MKFFIGFLFFIISLKVYSSGYYINSITINGNEKTKNEIILRELTFKVGDVIQENQFNSELETSENNILNTSIFNYAHITSNFQGDKVDIIVTVEERWYLWPVPTIDYYERNFSVWLQDPTWEKTTYGLTLYKYNFRGRDETIKFSVILGYENQYIFSYKDIFLDKNRKHSVGFDFEISHQAEMIYNTENSIVNTIKESEPVLEKQKYTLSYVYRPQFFLKNYLYINYLDYQISDTVYALNKNYLPNKNQGFDLFTIDNLIIYDKRDSKPYPLEGVFFEYFLHLSVPANFNYDDFNLYFLTRYYHFKKLANRFYMASALDLKLSLLYDNSFLNSEALGYANNIQGYENYVINGQHFITLKNIIKYNLIPRNILKLRFLPYDKFNKIHYAFYINAFLNLGYVSNVFVTYLDEFANSMLYSYGVGIDFVTYYDLVLRMDFSINHNGDEGFYFHLNAPINRR